MKGQVAIPASSEELEELLNDDGRMGDILAAGQFGDFTRAYQAAWAAKNLEMVRQFREQMQADLQSFYQDQAQSGCRPREGFRPGAPGPALAGRAGRRARAIAGSLLPDAEKQAEKQALFNAAAMGAGDDIDGSPYASSLRKFLYTTLKGEGVAGDAGDTEEVARIQQFKGALARAMKIRDAMGERVPSEGGFLLPENLRSEILMVSLESSVIRPRATVIPMDSLRVPLPSIDDTSHTANVFGGVAAFWTEEGATLQVSAPSFSRVVLEARKLTAYTEIPNELLQDAVTSLDTWFTTFFPQAVAFFEDVAFISGTGVGEPQGIISAPGAVTVNAASAGHIQFADIAKAYSRFWPASLRRAIWLAAPDVLPELLQLAVSADGTGTTVAPPGWLQGMQAIDTPGGGNDDGFNYTLLGRPLRLSEKVPFLGSGTAGALTLVDPSYYLLGDRQAMQVATSAEYRFGSDMIAYRIIERVDGRFWLQSPITPANGSGNTLAPLVKINA